jgi:hypothetical protein
MAKKKTLEEIKAETAADLSTASETDEVVTSAFQTRQPYIDQMSPDNRWFANSAAIGDTGDKVFSIEREPEYERLDEFGRTMSMLFWLVVVCFILGAGAVLIHEML